MATVGVALVLTAFTPTADADPVFLTVDPGPTGGPANFDVSGTFAADDQGFLDVFVIFAPKTIVAPRTSRTPRPSPGRS